MAAAGLGIAAVSQSAMAADQVDAVQYASAGNEVTFLGGVGYTWLKGNEVVYDGGGNRISHLIWETRAPVLTGSFNAEVSNGWRVAANGVVGFSGDSHMEDYDWLAPFAPGSNWEDWTHQSIHPDTKLDRYVNLDIALGRDFAINDSATINLHGGFKYTNVKWTAHGGSLVYSVNGFRDTVANFPDGQSIITFEQRYPGLFLGAEATVKSGAFTFSGLARGGFTISATDTDHHWLRSLRFEEKYDPIPFISLGAKADYAITEKAGVFVAANFEKYFRKKGDSTLYDIESGNEGPTYSDSAGMDFYSVTLSAGFKLAF
ncbi:omptin family outer membrane protease [Tianweitania sp. Rool2]|uniref:Omptin family outer membrane protease n=2 Tax=Oryzicola mucosus TaxID=2767425 RepID=A0A8J6U8K6_9HYPH|nr:omptin family outer membrane protease [Oryzicola mucosus]